MLKHGNFITLQDMNEEEQLKKLQEELDALKKEFQHQYQSIIRLQETVNQMSGREVKLTTVKAHQPLSLENFIGLKLIHFVGIIVLVTGLSIGVKYAIDRELISEGLRIGLAYAAGLLLYLLSWKLRKNYVLFSAILLSGAMASLYFTTYAAFVYYGMLSFAVAFLVMAALTVYTVFEAIRYGRQEIAFLGLIGAYAIPFLISQNAERADLFFLYITVINLGVVFLSLRKKWKTIASVAQAITWVLFLAWAVTRYETSQQATGIIFMLVFFLVFVFSIVGPRILYQQKLLENDSYAIVLNNVALFIAAQSVIGGLKDADDMIALISFCMSAFVALQSFIVYRVWKDEMLTVRILALLALALFVFFIVVNWDGFTVTFLWLLTAVLLFAWGFRIRSVQARMAAMLLMGLTLGKLLVVDSIQFTTIQKVIAYLVLGVLLLVVSFFYQKFKGQIFGKEEDPDGINR